MDAVAVADGEAVVRNLFTCRMPTCQHANTQVSDAELPCEMSKFLSTYMQPVLPEGLKLDFKATSYKKLGKFLHSLHASGVLDIILDKNVIFVTDVHDDHPWFAGIQAAHYGVIDDVSQEFERVEGLSCSECGSER